METNIVRKLSKAINFVVICAFFITGCVNPKAEEETHTDREAIVTDEKENEVTTMSDNKKVAVVLARDRYQSLEFNPVISALKDTEYEIIIASDEKGTAKGTQEDTEIDIEFAHLNTDELAGIIIIGGSSSLWENGELHAVLMEMDKDDKLVAAICYGSVVLAEAGVIGEGDIACWYNSPESNPVMAKYGVEDSGADVTIAENIITGDGPNAADEFAQAIIEFLS